MIAGESEVLVERRGHVGQLTLNRPKAINALTHEMVCVITDALTAWLTDDAVRTVVVMGSGDRGLCAGGDVVSLHRSVTQDDGSEAAAFWRDEYAMNALIAGYPKPYVAIQDGLVLGGGIGVSAHGSHRIVTERSRLGFPEVSIGFVPDVGATWLLSRAPGELGTRLALTAGSVGPADAILVGFADAHIRSELIPTLLRRLELETPDVVIAELASEPEPGLLGGERHWTDPAFDRDSVEEIIGALRERGGQAAELADIIAAKSPFATAVTLEALRRARDLPSLESALDKEYRVSRHISLRADFAEGVRAQLIDKDRQPRWHPMRHAEVAQAAVAACFEAPPEGDLGLAASNWSKETP